MRFSRIIIPALLVLGMLAALSPSNAQVSVGISTDIAPPALPVYEQPPIPGSGYFWTPGYWAWGPEGYYWVPGTWVQPPTIGFLWTPPWWGWNDGVYLFHDGYWGPNIGFYGGIDYGYGYFGSGYDGGRWDHGRFFYNREVNNFGGRRFANVYSGPVNRPAGNHVSFNGGTGGITAQPNAQEQAALREHHLGPTGLQSQHINAARSNPALLAKTNNGQPAITATSRAARFNSTGAATTTSTGAATTKSTTPRVQGNTRTTNAGPTGSTGTRTGGAPGPRTLHSTGPINKGGGSNPPGHVTNQTMQAPVHPQGQPHPQPQPQPKGQPSGKDQNKKPGQ